jgi:hypothetical protein
MIRTTSEVDNEAYENQADYEDNFCDGKDKFGFREYLYRCKKVQG